MNPFEGELDKIFIKNFNDRFQSIIENYKSPEDIIRLSIFDKTYIIIRDVINFPKYLIQKSIEYWLGKEYEED